MNFELLYWHWIVLGGVLILMELVITTFFILWFGVAAVLMGIVLLFAPDLPLTWQLLGWTLLSLLMAILWFKFIKPLSVDKTQAGLSREAIVGQVGQVIAVPRGEQRGRLRFPAPILGNDEWNILSQDAVREGDRVRVKDVLGNALMVEKV